MYGVIEAEADTLSQALSKVQMPGEPLPEGRYIDDSFTIDHDGIPVLNPEG